MSRVCPGRNTETPSADHVPTKMDQSYNHINFTIIINGLFGPK